MKPYQALATVYDLLQEDIDYNAWFQHIKALIDANGLACQHLLELGAGTGRMSLTVAAHGIHVTAIEPEAAMLSQLADNMANYRRYITCFNGQLDDFQTKRYYDGAMACLDVINYIPPGQLATSLDQLADKLDDSGFIYFDWSSPYKLSQVLSQNTFAEQHDDFAYIWENNYSDRDNWLDFDFTLFLADDDGRYRRYVERHRQYSYAADTIMKAVQSRFRHVELRGDHFKDICATTQRYHLFAWERQCHAS